MKKKIGVSAILFTMLILLIACMDNTKRNEEEHLQDDINKKEEIKTQRDEIKELIDSMSINEKIGQLMIVGFNGTSVDENINDLIKTSYIGGVILFGNNVESLNGVTELINNIKLSNMNNKIPLFISVDEEGGVVSRTPNEFLKLPSSLSIGAYNNKEMCYEVGEIIANELKLMGYNMDYAPVLDILSNPNNTVIGSRAFGRDADIVYNLGISVMKGINENNVIPVVKHFPGHGDTSVDSHYGLPLVEKSLNELKELEFIPFQNAINSGADAIMVSHILLKNIDSENPATMSKKIVSDILRDEMNFKGVVISDDMTMAAIMDNYDIGEASVKAINAGVDIILVCHGYDNEIKVLTSISEAVNSGEITEERLDESVYRILSLKNKYDLSDTTKMNSIGIEEINNKINNLFY